MTALPSVTDCYQIMAEYSMLDNIRKHSIIVARAARVLHSRLSANSMISDLPPVELLVAGALLHDVAKTECLDRQCDHASVGADICLDLGYPAIAEIVAEHVRLKTFAPKRYESGIFLAKEIVYYADKRVLHDKVVGLPQRLEYIMDRYGNNDSERIEIIKANFSRCVELEDWLCHYSGARAETLLESMTHEELI